MKKTMIVLVLATVLVLSLSAVAVAKYAGYAYNTAGGGHVGYLSWAGAKSLMTANGVDVALQNTPHGGYTANTTKCAVCHSVHRAASDLTAAGVGSYWKLTPGSRACVACHTASGSNPIPTALVEWSSTYTNGGPHSSFNCLGACHGSVHGGTTSSYGAIVAFNLTNRNDAAITAAFAAGNVSGNTPATAGGSNGGSGTYALIDDASFAAYSTTTAQDLATMRAMATGYTCGASGCHSSSQFAVNKHGYAELRAGNPSASTTLDTVMTGHITNMPSGCGPCHTTSDNKCAACHDMRGKATNSSAFPHGNRDIVVYERTAGQTAWDVEKTVVSGNLWMYAGDATYRDIDGNVASSGGYWTAGGVKNTNSGASARTVVEDAAGFHGGSAGKIIDGVCLKCHGYKYWPTHGLTDPATPYGGTGHGNSAVLNFATK